MNTQRRQVESPVRSGFTLVELLVAMTIFVILATLTVAGFRNSGADRISAATGTFRNALDGARSRAIKAGEARGLRLIQDSNDPRIVTSMVYVGSPGVQDGFLRVRREGGVWRVTESLDNSWQALFARGLMQPGNRVEIPANSGNWYTLVAMLNDEPPDWQIAGHYEPAIWDTGTVNAAGESAPSFVPLPRSPGDNVVPVRSVPIPYRMELSATILPGAEPISLPAQTCIDLDGSIAPGRAGSGSTDPPPGTFGGHLDVLFTPRGTLAGGLATSGLIVFRVAHVSDQLIARANINDPLTASSTPVLVLNPEKGHKAVGIHARTGAVSIGEINVPVNSSSTFNNQATTSFGQVRQAYGFIFRGRGTN